MWNGAFHGPTARCRGCGRELKDLICGQHSIGQFVGRRIDGIAGAQSDCFFRDQHDLDARRYRNRLRSVLILNHQSATGALLYRAVRHARVRNVRPGDRAVGHSVMSGCAWRIQQNTTLRRTAQFLGKDDDLLREFCAVRLLHGCHADIRV